MIFLIRFLKLIWVLMLVILSWPMIIIESVILFPFQMIGGIFYIFTGDIVIIPDFDVFSKDSITYKILNKLIFF